MSTFRMELYHGEAYARDVELLPDETILSALRRAGVTELETPCGGNGTCKQCRVLLEQEEVLACQSAPGCDCRVTLPGTGEAVIETGGVVDIIPSEEGLGLAVDIGTTTVAVFLYNLGSGRLLGIESGRNAQRPFGADVISRIQHCSEEGGLEALRGAICAQLDASIDRLCARTGQKRGRIRSIAVAGNTVMEHIFDGLSPVSIGVAPFATLSLFDDCRPASVFFSGLAPDCEVYLCPALAGYVGGDITAGLYSSGASDSGKKVLYLDIGTNGEMGIGVSGDFLCCATAAGPAFEGAEITCGMDGSDGAIDRVRYVNQKIEIHVIGSVQASGVCGSGLIDAIAAMLDCGAVEESGRMVDPDEAPESVRDRLSPDENGHMRFFLDPEQTVFISAADVRQVQLAKAAIRAGIETLLSLKQLTAEDIDEVLIAGGFGAYMDVGNACRIGLLPAPFAQKARHVGNAAGYGAALSLVPAHRRALSELASRCQYYELSGSAVFMDNYVDCMFLEEC